MLNKWHYLICDGQNNSITHLCSCTTCTCMCIVHEFHSAVETTTVILADNVVELELLKATFFCRCTGLKM